MADQLYSQADLWRIVRERICQLEKMEQQLYGRLRRETPELKIGDTVTIKKPARVIIKPSA